MDTLIFYTIVCVFGFYSGVWGMHSVFSKIQKQYGWTAAILELTRVMGVVRSGNKSILVPCFSFWIFFFLLLCFVEFEKWCFEEGGGKVMISTFYITVILTSICIIARLLRRPFLSTLPFISRSGEIEIEKCRRCSCSSRSE